MSFYENGLYELTESIIENVLGVDGLRTESPGYGFEFQNDVFEMHKEDWSGERGDEPNFHHYRTGLKVWWYKHIGRSEEANQEMSFMEWAHIVEECVGSLEKGR